MKILNYIWALLVVGTIVLVGCCFVFIGDQEFVQNFDTFKGARKPYYGLNFALTSAINIILFLTYRLKDNNPFVKRLKLPYDRVKNLTSATGVWINFLVFTMLYMTIHYFYPSLPCPRHILMMLVWLAVTIAFGVFSFRQFRIPNSI